MKFVNIVHKYSFIMYKQCMMDVFMREDENRYD